MYEHSTVDADCHSSQAASQPAERKTNHVTAAIQNNNDPQEHEADAIADRVMQMPDNHFVQRKCSCEDEEKTVQRKTVAPFIKTAQADIKTGSNDTLSNQLDSGKGNGKQLTGDVKTFMESGFGTDFSSVKIHTGNEAIQMSRQLNAEAFTSGNDIYFNAGKFAPDTAEGKHLLAHELAHTIQQSASIQAKLIQRKCHEKDNPAIEMAACAEGATDVGRQAQAQTNTLDAKAKAIIATAAGTGSNPDKAMQVVHDIICAYMPGQASKVKKINFFDKDPGLRTQSIGSGKTAQGNICVGESFLTGTTSAGLARRVLQVGHEMEHIDQYRAGMTGDDNKNMREFLAFYHEALADEFIGTGRLADKMRRTLIDAALGLFNCFTPEQKKEHASKNTELLARRTTVNGTNGNDPTNPPGSCVVP
jgi:hypothetical protein